MDVLLNRSRNAVDSAAENASVRSNVSKALAGEDSRMLSSAAVLTKLSVPGDDLRFVPRRGFTSPLQGSWLWFWVKAG